jgi:hypothetical protein
MSTKISDALSPGAVLDYHFEKGAANYSRSYYAEDGRATGVWFGKQCEALGLTPGAPVDLEHFKRLVHGQDPLTGEQLIVWRKPSDQGPKWARDQGAWKDHLEGLFVQAIADRIDPFRQQEYPGAMKSRGHHVDLAPTCHTERETKLLEMHAIARQTFVESLQSEEGAGARAYLAKRGIKETTAATFGLGLSNASGRQLREKLQDYGPELMKASGVYSSSAPMEAFTIGSGTGSCFPSKANMAKPSPSAEDGRRTKQGVRST